MQKMLKEKLADEAGFCNSIRWKSRAGPSAWPQGDLGAPRELIFLMPVVVPEVKLRKTLAYGV